MGGNRWARRTWRADSKAALEAKASAVKALSAAVDARELSALEAALPDAEKLGLAAHEEYKSVLGDATELLGQLKVRFSGFGFGFACGFASSPLSRCVVGILRPSFSNAQPNPKAQPPSRSRAGARQASTC